MSSTSEYDLSCPVCHDIFKDPVVLSCSHSFCRDCLQEWWKGKVTNDCPCCKRKSSKREPPCNLALKNLCETFLLERNQRAADAICSLHSEKLKIFCLDHQEPVCVICRDSKMHNNHKFRPIDEAAQDHRQEIQCLLKPLKEKLELFEKVKEKCNQTEKHIKVQAQQTEGQIKEQFKKLHQFLQEEEKVRIAALREEEEKKCRMMKEKIDGLSRDIAALSNTIKISEKELKAEDISFLKNYKAAVRRIQQRPVPHDPQLVSGALIDAVKHLGNLTFNIWNKMKKMVSYTPVLLDPNTADPELIVSEDLSSVRSGKRQQLPQNPERTKFTCSVINSVGYSSGTHVWDVDVGDNTDWELGVLREFVQTSGQLQSGLWRILFSNGKFSAFSTSDPEKELSVNKLKRIRVHLDFERGKLAFLDLDTNTNIHSFAHRFTGTLFPYIYTENPLPLKILPVNVSVAVEKHR